MEYSKNESIGQTATLESELLATIDAIDKEKAAKEVTIELEKNKKAKEGADMVEGNNALNKSVWNGGNLGAGLRQIENNNNFKINSLREKINSNIEAIARIKEMVEVLKINKMSSDVISGYEKRINLAEEELLRQQDLLTVSEQEENRILQTNQKIRGEQEKIAYNPVNFAAESIVDAQEVGNEGNINKNELVGMIDVELKNRENEKERLVNEERDRNMLEKYEVVLVRAQQTFEQLKNELNTEKSKWNEDLNSVELFEKVKTLKENIENNLKGGLRLIFKKNNNRRAEIARDLEILAAIRADFMSRSVMLQNRFRDFSNKTQNRGNSSESDINLLSLSPALISSSSMKNSEINSQMSRISADVEDLTKNIEDFRINNFDFDDIDEKIITNEERQAFELRMRNLS